MLFSSLAIILAELYIIFYILYKFPGEKGSHRNQKIVLTSQIGTGLFLGIIIMGLIASFFLAAISGMNLEKIIANGFILSFILAFYLAMNAVIKRKQAYQNYGLSFEDDMAMPGLDYNERESSADEVQLQNHLYLLNLERGVDLETLKKRYREVSLLYHPDRLALLSTEQRKVAEEEFKRISEAKEFIEKYIKNLS